MRENTTLFQNTSTKSIDMTAYMTYVQSDRCREAEAAYRAKDYTKSVALYAADADEGNCFAKTRLALYHHYGEGVTKDQQKALDLFREAAEEGCPLAACWIAEYLWTGKVCAKDQDTAETIYESALPDVRKIADAGDMYAKYFYAYNLLLGICLEIDEVEAFQMLQESADKGCDAARIRLASCYVNGDGTGTDYLKALELLHDDSYEEAAQRLNLLGSIYLFGKGIQADKDLGIYYLEQAAAMGYVRAKTAMAAYYYDNPGQGHMEKAIYWYTICADQDHDAFAASMLAYIYYHGADEDVKVEPDGEKMWKYYLCAAMYDENYTAYMVNIAWEYYNGSIFGGKYVHEDKDEAYKWMKKAAQAGSQYAKEVLAQQDGDWTKVSAKNPFTLFPY